MPDHVPQPKIPWDSLAEQRIREAQAAGEFDNLPGFGQPIPGIDEPYDELWWVKDKLKREQLSVLPPALAIRFDVEQTVARLPMLATEAVVRDEIAALNDRIRKASFAVTWGPSVDVVPIEVEEFVREWRARNCLASSISVAGLPLPRSISGAEASGRQLSPPTIAINGPVRANRR